jgi:hypothetical protein
VQPESTDSPGGPEAFTAEHRAALDARQVDVDRTLSAIHRLEAAGASAAPLRTTAWRDEVLSALVTLEAAALEEETAAARPESLLSDITRSQPRLRNRVRGLRTAYRQVRDAASALRTDITASGDDIDVSEVRQRIASLLNALRYQRARESDLIYEAYYDAFRRDVLEETGSDGSRVD